MLEYLLRQLEIKNSVWGSADFVELTIALNIAFFAIEKVRRRVGFAKSKAVELLAITKLQIDDQAEKDGITSLLSKIAFFAARCHRRVWATCRALGYFLAGVGGLILYFGAVPNSYYFLLLYSPAFYLTATFSALLCLRGICFCMSKTAGIKPTKLSLQEIQIETDSLIERLNQKGNLK